MIFRDYKIQLQPIYCWILVCGLGADVRINLQCRLSLNIGVSIYFYSFILFIEAHTHQIGPSGIWHIATEIGMKISKLLF